MAARRFLWIVAGLIMLTFAAAFTYSLFGVQILRVAMVPTVSFEASPKPSDPDYSRVENWLAHPALTDNDALWTPEGFQPAPKPGAAAFYVPPTAYLRRDRWNAPLDDESMNERLSIFVRGQASIFNGVAEIWAPRYRQATFGAFLTQKQDATRALDFAYADVLRAFDVFVASIPPTQPIILAGHSQGSLHVLRLLTDRVADQPVAQRIVAAYVVGWPISAETDLPRLGLPACTRKDQAGCILSWQTFAEPADPSLILTAYDESPGYNGSPRRGTPIVCTNPLLGLPSMEPVAPDMNLGSLVPNANLSGASLEPGRVGARCDERGFLLIGSPPSDFGRFVLPGNNYHVYDYALFWANLRADAEARLNSYLVGQKRGFIERLVSRTRR